MNKFSKWLDTFVQEKNFDLTHDFDVEAEQINGAIRFSDVVNYVKELDGDEGKKIQAEIKSMLVKIDFHNGDCMHYFAHLAQGIALTHGVTGFIPHRQCRSTSYK